MSTVLATFSVLKDHVKLKVTQDTIAIDNYVFKLHYRATFLLLLVGCLMVSSQQFIGEHIRCIAGAGKDSSIDAKVIDTYCFFTSTYTVVKYMNATLVEQGEVAHPGVGPAGKNDPIIHHAYYQWVPFVLFFQAILFYLPHYLWRGQEGGRLKMLVSGLQLACISLNDEEIKTKKMTVPSKRDKQEKVDQIRVAFLNRIHVNRPWAFLLCCCEVLNFLNVILQIYLTDWFLKGAFLGLGHTISSGEYTGKMNPLDVVFPKVTKCIFHKYGASGSIQKHDALCVMALNIVNEKIYTFLWFWFIVLAIITGLGLVWRLLTMLLYARSTAFNRYVFFFACPGRHNPWTVLRGIHDYTYSDWLFLYYIAKNLDNYVFKELLQKLADDLEVRREMRFRQLMDLGEQQPLTTRL